MDDRTRSPAGFWIVHADISGNAISGRCGPCGGDAIPSSNGDDCRDTGGRSNASAVRSDDGPGSADRSVAARSDIDRHADGLPR